MKRAIVVGSGAGGAAAAMELQGIFDVTVLEAGREFKPFSMNLRIPGALKKAGLLFDEREIGFIFPPMDIRRARDKMILVRGIGTGGTTTIAAGNALRLDHDLRRLGIDLDDEFKALSREIPMTAEHRRLWREPTRRLFRICGDMGLDPQPIPKMGHYERCRSCGRCVLGCPHGVKWDSRIFLREAVAKGAALVTGMNVERVVIEAGGAKGVWAGTGRRRRFIPADVVVLAAGGLGTPVILADSGIACEPRLFVDPVLCLAAPWPKARQNSEIPMPFFVRKEGYIVSPYFDHLSYFFNRKWKPPADDILSLMIKLADTNAGSIAGKKAEKGLSPRDVGTLKGAVDFCTEIFGRMGVGKDDLFLGTINAGHPGGMLPLTARESATLHHERLPGNLHVADASLLPAALGAPPSLTIMALARKVAAKIKG